MTLGISEPIPNSSPPLSLGQAFDLLLPKLSERRNWCEQYMEGQESLFLSAADFQPQDGGPNPYEAICRLLGSDAGHLKNMLEKKLNLVDALHVSFNFKPDKVIVFSASEVDIEHSKIGQSPTMQVAPVEREGRRRVVRDVRNHGGYGVGGG